MASYVTLLQALQTTLQTITGLTVFIGEQKALGAFPAACISNFTHTNEFEDLKSNKRQYQFIIRFYYRTDLTNDPDFELKLSAFVDSAITAIEHDVTLGGICDYSTPSIATWVYGEKEVPVRGCEIKVTCVAHVAR